MPIDTARSLFEAIDERGTTLEDHAAFDQQVWQECGTSGALLVTDLSGFTRSTKTYGILQFLSIFRRFQKLCMPILEDNSGSLIKQEADDLFGCFPDAPHAIDAAVEMMRAVAYINASSEPKDQIGLSVGIEYGHFLRLSDDAYGDPVNVAFKLGEDIAKTSEIRLGPVAYAQAQELGYSFEGCTLDGPVSVEVSRVELEHYILRT
jgi:adenylate cyclase